MDTLSCTQTFTFCLSNYSRIAGGELLHGYRSFVTLMMVNVNMCGNRTLGECEYSSRLGKMRPFTRHNKPTFRHHQLRWDNMCIQIKCMLWRNFGRPHGTLGNGANPSRNLGTHRHASMDGACGSSVSGWRPSSQSDVDLNAQHIWEGT